MVSIQVVDEHGRLVRDGLEDTLDSVATRDRVPAPAEEQRRAVKTGDLRRAANRGDGRDARVGCRQAGRHPALRVAEGADVVRVETVIVGARRVLSLLEQPVQAHDRRQRISPRGRGAERGDHDETVRGELLHQHRVGSAPRVRGGVDDTCRGVLLGIVSVTVRPHQDGVAVPAVLEVCRTIDVESLLLVPVHGVRRIPRQWAHALLGGDLEGARDRGIGRGPLLANTTTRRAIAARAAGLTGGSGAPGLAGRARGLPAHSRSGTPASRRSSGLATTRAAAHLATGAA